MEEKETEFYSTVPISKQVSMPAIQDVAYGGMAWSSQVGLLFEVAGSDKDGNDTIARHFESFKE